MTLEFTGNLEIWKLVVTQVGVVEQSTFLLRLLPTGKTDYWVSEEIDINASDSAFKSEVRKFFRNEYGTDIDVVSTTEEEGTEGEVDFIRTRTYEITVREPINVISFSSTSSSIIKRVVNDEDFNI